MPLAVGVVVPPTLALEEDELFRPPPHPSSSTKAKRVVIAARDGQNACPERQPPSSSKQANSQRGTTADARAAVVLTVTVRLAVLVPSRVSDEGEIEQVELAGAPEQAKRMGALKPPSGDTDSMYFAV